MELDKQMVKYMQKRAEYAKLYACALSVQCFVLAVFFCIYGLFETGLFYSQSKETGRLIIIVISIVISLVLCAFDVMVCIKYKEFAKIYPDEVAVNQSRDTIEEAYRIARPVLVLKITISIALILFSGLVYIGLMILMEKTLMSCVYGRLVVFVIMGFAILISVPCIDRIETYKAMLNIRHMRGDSIEGLYPYALAVSIFAAPVICSWYILRCYSEMSDIAWIVFPMALMFALAFAFLSKYIVKRKRGN